ncbi:MAG TPA: hypothetical protein PLA43_17320 [Bryobacteraceae bacterium]|nr:hypothetical protein [Bryobacteraceae bacterium]HOQ45010.1 hypothetical protein [Bryobacteraceae bacterium]HPU73714.1 hypothetical protein [Bryobacteraceae bacterium]
MGSSFGQKRRAIVSLITTEKEVDRNQSSSLSRVKLPIRPSAGVKSRPRSSGIPIALKYSGVAQR